MMKIDFDGRGLKKFAEAVEALGSEARAKKAFAMGLNKTARKVNTIVKREVAKQAGITQASAVKRGGLRVIPAQPGRLEAEIFSRGGYIPLKDFKPRALDAGVSAAPWGSRRTFDGTFLDRGSMAKTGFGPRTRPKAGGHVFKRTDKLNKISGRHNAIESLWGPAIPAELVKDETAKAFETIAARELPVEIGRAITALTKGVVR